MAAPPGPRSAPPGDPDPAARRLIASMRRYVATNPGVSTAHGMRAVAFVAAELADQAVDDAHAAGESWASIARALGLQPGSVNQTGPRRKLRRPAPDLQETGTG